MPERIERAAIRHGDTVYSLPRPARHHAVIKFMAEKGFGPGDMLDQGFETDQGRFVDRYEAVQIAREAGQILVKHQPEDKLFSEDMW